MKIQSRNLTVLNYPELSLTAPFMGESLAVLSSDRSFVGQIATATGIVNSSKPYVEGRLVVHVLRSKAVASQWVAQAQRQPIIGSVTVYPDSSNSSPVTVADCLITNIDQDAYDGVEPTTKITITCAVPNPTLGAGV